MTQYTITENDLLELLDIPNQVFPYDSSVQNRTFPIEVVNKGVAANLSPEEIANGVYDSLANLTLRRFSNIVQPDSIKDYAKFIQAAVQKKLESCITEEEEIEEPEIPEGDD